MKFLNLNFKRTQTAEFLMVKCLDHSSTEIVL
jgi:hypothetical protein